MERIKNINSIVDRALREVRQHREEKLEDKTKRIKRFLKMSPLVGTSLKF